VTYPRPGPAEEGSDRAALVGTWLPARVSPLHKFRCVTIYNFVNTEIFTSVCKSNKRHAELDNQFTTA